MKILKKGQTAPVNWWVGAKLTCVRCGQQAELEESDKESQSIRFCGPFGDISLLCTNCKTPIEFKNLNFDQKVISAKRSIESGED